MLSISEPSLSDAIEIGQFHARSWQLHYRGAFSDHFLDNLAVQERIEVWTNRLENPKVGQFVRVAKQNGKIIGLVCAYLNEDVKYGTLLDNLHVALEMKGKGLGKSLMCIAAQEIQQRYPEKGMYLWVLQQNTESIGFYELLGGIKKETVTEKVIGDKPALKCRYFWPSMERLLIKTP